MKNKKSIFKISGIVFLLVFILVFTLAGCKTQNKTAGETTILQTETTIVVKTTVAETPSTVQLSEQPDKTKYNEYFSDFYLGKLPKGTDANPTNVPVKTAVFTSEDQFCSVWTQKKDIPVGSLSGAVYDVGAKKDFEPRSTFGMAVSAGGHMGSQPLIYPSGKYEYKLYIDNILVIVIPFEVLDSETTTTSTKIQSTSQLSEQPDKAKHDEYFTEFYLAKAPKGQQIPQIHPGSSGLTKTDVFIASEDEFCVTGTLKKEIPSGSFYVAVYDTIAKKDFVPKTALPAGFKPGSFGWVDDPINFPIGKYEYKVYIDDALVIAIPFEVR